MQLIVAILDQPDPVAKARQLISGYETITPLTAEEHGLIHLLVCLEEHKFAHVFSSISWPFATCKVVKKYM